MAERGSLETPQDLANYPIIHQRDRSEWVAWLAQAGCAGLSVKEEITITDTNTVMHAALEGQGVSLGVFPFVEQELNAGKLIKPFDIELKPTRSFYLLVKPSSERTPEVAAVIRWLLDQAGAS
jgi:LysR family glycine cleavage system transcriptional activator